MGSYVFDMISIIFIVGVLSAGPIDCRPVGSPARVQYEAINCRKHAALLTDFGGKGDGKTLNTKAFQTAIASLSKSASDGGAQLVVPPGKWLTGAFSLTSHFTLFLDKDAVILGSQEEADYPVLPPLPSYGRGRDTQSGRYGSLIFGTNLTDIVITGANGTIDGQGASWWDKFKKENILKYTRPYLIEIMFSDQVQISNITLLNSPSWNIHPTYSSNVIVQGVTILAPVSSPNTDGINPDSCTNTKIQDCYIVSGDDCVAVKSGWDQYGIKFGMPTKHLIIRRLTCVSPFSALIALGSELSGGIQDVRAEDLTAVQTESAVRIKTAPGRGGFVEDIYVKNMKLETMKYVFWMAGSYGQHPDTGYNTNVLTVVKNINYRDVVAKNVSMSANLAGLEKAQFTGICLSNVTIQLAPKPKELQWNCTDIQGVSSDVKPTPCTQLQSKGAASCGYPIDKLPIDTLQLKTCSF